MKAKNRKENKTINKVCKACGDKFKDARSWAEFCSNECRHFGWAKGKIEERRRLVGGTD